MERTSLIEHLQAESAALLAAHRADPDAPVASCPGWDRTELLRHVAQFHSWMRAQVEAGPDERVRFRDTPVPGPDDDLATWYEANVAGLVAALQGVDLDGTWPTFAGPQPGLFYPRRMALETAVHRWDADGAPIDPELAVEGIDEILTLFAPMVPGDRLEDAAGTIHLHATDVDGEWLVTLGADGIRSEHGHAKGDVALRGTASDLYLWTWNRVPADDRFEVFGEPELLAVWRRAVAF
jgi:uncharacterized protein (TIGR03083 family)